MSGFTVEGYWAEVLADGGKAKYCVTFRTDGAPVCTWIRARTPHGAIQAARLITGMHREPAEWRYMRPEDLR